MVAGFIQSFAVRPECCSEADWRISETESLPVKEVELEFEFIVTGMVFLSVAPQFPLVVTSDVIHEGAVPDLAVVPLVEAWALLGGILNLASR